MAHAFKNGMPVKITEDTTLISGIRKQFAGLSGTIDDMDANKPWYQGAFFVRVKMPDGDTIRESFNLKALSPDAERINCNKPTPSHPFRDGMRVQIRSDRSKLPSDEKLFAGLIGVIRDSDADDPTYDANGALYVYFSDDVLSSEMREYMSGFGNKDGVKSFNLSSMLLPGEEADDQAEMLIADGEQAVCSGPGDDDDDGESLPLAAFESFTADQDFPLHLGGFFGK